MFRNLLLLVSLFLAGCSAFSSPPTPTPTARPTSTPAPTSTPTVTPTPTPTPPTFTSEQLAQMNFKEKLAAAPEKEGYTAWMPVGQFVIYEGADGSRAIAYDFSKGEWKEIKQYQVTQPENFRDYQIPWEDLFNGEYLLWLYTLSQPFDTAKIKDVPLTLFWGQIIYDTSTAPNFKEPGTAPFRRDVTSGLVVYEEGGYEYNYIVLPVEYYDKESGQSRWVIIVKTRYRPGYATTLADDQNVLKTWREDFNITVILTTPLKPFDNIPDPLVAKTFASHPDMEERFERFLQGDMAALSEPGIVLLTSIFGSNKPWMYQ